VDFVVVVVNMQILETGNFLTAGVFKGQAAREFLYS
jgi:hypothetical protein